VPEASFWVAGWQQSSAMQHKATIEEFKNRAWFLGQEWKIEWDIYREAIP
jgi:hypothetical protein